MARMTRKPLPALMFALLAGASLGGCSNPPPAASTVTAGAEAPPAAEAPAAPAAAEADVFRFRIGELDAVALRDGDIDVPNDGSVFGVGQPVADVAAVLADAGLETGALHLSIQPLLVHSGARVLLFDTGAGNADFARAGRLPASLHDAGVEPGQVTDIFISHAHPDHVGGVLASDGTLAFPNAAIHLSAPDGAALKQRPDAAALVGAIGSMVATFEPGAEVVPGVVTAVTVDGHTPGHSAYEIASGDAKLLYIGDAAHHYVISLRRPQWTVQFDGDAALAKASRGALLQRAAAGNLRVYAVHFPFPGLGRVQAEGDGFAWVPER
jgi:glyoxylase-like metal-dependent hydrolase (beta-lactamase superfamily II)